MVVKVSKNTKRDAEAISNLLNLDWKVEIIWACELKNPDLLRARIISFFSNSSNNEGAQE